MTEPERRAFNRGLQVAIDVVTLYGDENRRMALDTVNCDPLLARTNELKTAGGWISDLEYKALSAKSGELAVLGHGHASVFQACEAIVAMLREAKA